MKNNLGESPLKSIAPVVRSIMLAEKVSTKLRNNRHWSKSYSYNKQEFEKLCKVMKPIDFKNEVLTQPISKW